jgi:hypothetical protein
LVDHIDEAVTVVGRIGEIDRERVRRHVEKKFSRERMVEHYIKA